MSNEDKVIVSGDLTSKRSLEEEKQKAAKRLGIILEIPKQEKRIKALQKLYDKYSSQINIRGFLYVEIIESCERLIDIYEDKQRKLDEIKILSDPFSVTKIKLENINFQYKEEEKKLEKNISFHRSVLESYTLKYLQNKEISTKHRKYLKSLEDICWENWLRSLDVHKELINTIIGFESRKALFNVADAYMNYYVMLEFEISKCFKALKKLKRDGLEEYYDALTRYALPLQKKIDFKLFLQKRIESKLADSVDLKYLLGDFSDFHRSQIEKAVNQVKEQYKRDQQDLMSVVNYFKTFLLQKQALFTTEIEQLVLYLKKRYVEKMDFLCLRFQMFTAAEISSTRKIKEDDAHLLKQLIEEELYTHVRDLKIDYSKRVVPLLDNFWNLEQAIGKAHVLDEETTINKFSELKNLKNMNLKHLIEQFEEERTRINNFFNKKIDLVMDAKNTGIKAFDVVLTELKDDCDLVCCELMNLNSRFWTKAHAEFNCEVRKILIKLRRQYSPYIKPGRRGSHSWMKDYLITNFNQELLMSVGESLEGFSPESELYKFAARGLLFFNEYSRKVFLERDEMEAEYLLKLSSLPNPDISNFSKLSEEKLEIFRKKFDCFWKDYNVFYSSLLGN